MKNQEKIIKENHAADVANGLTEAQASESDAFERRVMGVPDEDWDEHGNPRRNSRGVAWYDE